MLQICSSVLKFSCASVVLCVELVQLCCVISCELVVHQLIPSSNINCVLRRFLHIFGPKGPVVFIASFISCS